MRIDQESQYSYINIYDEDGFKDYEKRKKVQNSQILLICVSGSGKTLATEAIAHEYHNKGYLVLVLTEKELNPLEFAFCMFEPKADYHLKILRDEQGEPPQKQNAILYHPFTFNFPFNKQQPNYNLFTLPINQISRDAWSILLNTTRSNRAVGLLKNQADKLKDNESMLEFLNRCQRAIKRELEEYSGKPLKTFDDDLFLEASEEGDIVTISQISSNFKPLLNHYFLQSTNFKYNIDFKKVLKNHKSYHILTTKYINDRKLKYFVIISFLDGLLKNLNKNSPPLCIILEEVRVFVPNRSDEIYIKRMAEGMRDRLSEVRNAGNGVTTIANSQVYFDIDDKYRDSMTETFLGRLCESDVKSLSSTIGLDINKRRQLLNMRRNFFIKMNEEDGNDYFCIFLPPHCHAEEGYDFDKMFKATYPDKLKNFTEEEEFFKKNLEGERRRAKERIKKYTEQRKLVIEKMQEYKLKKEAKEKSHIITKEDIKKEKEDRYIMCYNDRVINKLNYADIAKKHNITQPTAKTYALKGKALVEEREKQQQNITITKDETKED